MKKSTEKEASKNSNLKVKTFPIPFPVKKSEITEIFLTNTFNKMSKEEIISKAFNLHTQGEFLKAERYYRYFIKKGFLDHRVFTNLGTILRDNGKLKEAELLQRKAIKIQPDFAISHYNLGTILRDHGKLDEAEVSTRKAIKLKPDFTEAYFNLGNILSDLGKFKEAEIVIRKVIQLNPDFIDAYSFLGKILKDLEELSS